MLLVILPDGETMLVLHVHRQMISRGEDVLEVQVKSRDLMKSRVSWHIPHS